MATTLAVDIGGTKIAAGLVDPDGRLLFQTRQPTPRTHDPDQVWAVTLRTIDDALAAAGGAVDGVGIAAPGPIDLPTQSMSPINMPAWRGFPIRDRVMSAVPDVPVRMAGDGLCMALGEHWRGAGQGAAFLLGMVVSTGIGGGLILDGAPYHGRTGNAGHVGHVVVDIDGPPCTCGGRGCVEAIASGPHLAQWARSQGWDGADAKELADAAASGNEVALAAFRRGARAVAAMIASVGAVCDLDLVVLGGGVAKAGPVLFDPLHEELRTFAGLGFLSGLRVVPAALGGEAGLVGAAALLRG
ncbi:ROK family protein [Mycolicibacterium aichiense]|uniref:Sugar kinase n=1 Tax=Mycolicibacterium aichiense TaxID=1799 RepID=A0AAD1HRA7_9MYCO|nr:ROK family protein [Mycolicibacterium aichiense]MCV7016406.1 ROK family protein [Mycolicibacterium aichiense]BBX09820.1 sugar kinase [Mycolicibacterium aichiense]SUA14382.1 transcriptional regulator/sugar kinase [Mycolicibacterium aichiense]